MPGDAISCCQNMTFIPQAILKRLVKGFCSLCFLMSLLVICDANKWHYCYLTLLLNWKVVIIPTKVLDKKIRCPLADLARKTTPVRMREKWWVIKTKPSERRFAWFGSTCPLAREGSLANQHKDRLYPEGSGPFKDDSAPIPWHKDLLKWFNENENKGMNESHAMVFAITSPPLNSIEQLRGISLQHQKNI